ncbi:HAD family hydrolase [Gimesia aquarii]|uniref:NLI interacting factor-like phosphatase n=1 Tax=Gimesia aquarii TaxID=2527964 RepID=A0A517VU22_9PLAN|nr:HAD family hydrolase [Gimesia aquarii]QDT96480.1 NLI interacting factor-like phosphatase [Gimesia aquarii]
MNNEDQILLILDVDETLLYAAERCLHRDSDYRVGPYFVYLRPFLIEFLEQTHEHFQIAVWSSSSCDYVEAIVSTIFPNEIQPEFVWSRTRCVPRLDPERHIHYFVKDLKKVKRRGYDLDKVLIVEDTPQKVERNYGNAIYVAPFYGDDTDQELKFLSEYLLRIRSLPDLRRIEKRNWKNRF